MKRWLILAVVAISFAGTSLFAWKYVQGRRPLLTVGVFREGATTGGDFDLAEFLSDVQVSLGNDQEWACYGTGKTGVMGKAVFDFPGVDRVRVTAVLDGCETHSEWYEQVRPGDVLMVPLRCPDKTRNTAASPGELAPIRRRKTERRSRPTLENVGYPFMVPGTQPYDLAAELAATERDGALVVVASFSNLGPGELTRVNAVGLTRTDEGTGQAARVQFQEDTDLPAVRLDEALDMEFVDAGVPDGTYVYRLAYHRPHGDTDNANHDPRLRVRWEGGRPSPL